LFILSLFYDFLIATYFCSFSLYTAFLKVAGAYQNAIVVDSFATIKAIMAKEPRSLYQSETFIALDMINAPDIETHLRHIRRQDLGEIKLMYDLLPKPENIPNFEKAIRFVVRNTLVCVDREAARKVAYELGDNRTHSAISKKCGTLFKA